MASFVERIRGAYNAFTNENEDPYRPPPASGTAFGGFFGVRPGRVVGANNERTIISSIYTRMSVDVSSVAVRHVRHDDGDRYLEDVDSGLNECLTVEANLDQGASAFRQDVVLTIFQHGVAAVVAVDTTIDPRISGSFDVRSLRVGTVVDWYPEHVKVNLYNERTGKRQDITLPKRTVAIIENPLYSVMNEPNSTLQRLVRKLSLLDSADEATGSGKLDLIIQLPYVVKSDARRQQADQRRKDLEFQLKGSQYGIAYTDGTEKVTQLNRPAENNLLGQIEYLTNLLYGQLGITPEVMNGTADEATMLNYNNRTVEPLLRAITEAMQRVFLTKTARTQGQSVDFFREPFKLVPMANIAEMADKFTRNEIFTSNEIRQFIGVKPSKDPKADKLINSNMPQAATGVQVGPTPVDPNAVDPNAPPAVPVEGASLAQVDNAIGVAFADFGGVSVAQAPPVSLGIGDLDPSIMLASLDELDIAIDDAFNGLDGP